VTRRQATHAIIKMQNRHTSTERAKGASLNGGLRGNREKRTKGERGWVDHSIEDEPNKNWRVKEKKDDGEKAGSQKSLLLDEGHRQKRTRKKD